MNFVLMIYSHRRDLLLDMQQSIGESPFRSRTQVAELCGRLLCSNTFCDLIKRFSEIVRQVRRWLTADTMYRNAGYSASRFAGLRLNFLQKHQGRPVRGFSPPMNVCRLATRCTGIFGKPSTGTTIRTRTRLEVDRYD